jgi:hypothetical protein
MRTYATTWYHGVFSIPDSLRLRVAADRTITDVIDAMLLGQRPAPPGFDNAVAVWWLSESGRPEYLPTLLRFADDTNGTVATFAIYGLVQHLGDESVRSRLLDVDASAPPLVRNNMAGLLADVNDTHARALLARINSRNLSRQTVQRINRALRAPPRLEGRFRFPCLKSEEQARKLECTE